MMGRERSGTRWLGAVVLATPLAVSSLICDSAAGVTAVPAPAVPVTAVAVTAVAVTTGGSADARTIRSAAVGIDTARRAAVRSALRKKLRPALLTPIGWTGSTAACRAGAPSAEAQSSTLAAINFFRAMGRLDPVTLDKALSAQAQKAALMMDANFALDHDPPQSWSCWSAAGTDAAGQSNLCLGCSGAEAVAAYLIDSGDGNGVVGHRRWVMYPQTTMMGSGSTGRSNALVVFGSDAALSSNLPTWVAWPPPGYFPTELEPAGRWSLSASSTAVTFAEAKVVVRTAAGTRLKVTQEKVVNGYGSNTLVWQVSGLKLPTGTTARRLEVAVTGIRRGAAMVSRKYSVRLFNADARLKSTKAPRLTGEASVGQVLKVKAGAWSPAATSYSYAWYRDGTRVTGALRASYTLRTADAGTKITAKVTAHRGGYAGGVLRTAARAVSAG
jgi:uncharacterized protein YkwD